MLTICNRPCIVSLVLALLFLISVAADTLLPRAEAAEAMPHTASWRVLESTGSARYRLPGGASWSQAEVGDVLPPGTRIITDEAGTLTVERSGEAITMRPSARLMLPPRYLMHRARQEAGNLNYRIEVSRDHRFEVETPYASLLVKGTAFEVDVTDVGVAISVERGRVEVTSRAGAAAELAPGHAARVSASADHALEVRRSPDGSYVRIEPARSSWFDRFLEGVQSAPGRARSSAGGGTGSASVGGASVGGGSLGGGGASVGGASVGGASVGAGGVSVGGASVGGASVGGASVGRGGISVGGASVGGVSVGGIGGNRR
jgi:FecR protein